MNRPKQIGTAGETAFTRYAQACGFPGAERRALHGALDLGDVLLCPGVVVEVKSGKHAQKASRNQIHDWLQETEIERVNSNATIALLVTQHKGIGPARVHMWDAHFFRAGDIATNAVDSRIFDHAVTVTVEDALLMLRKAGWGEPA